MDDVRNGGAGACFGRLIVRAGYRSFGLHAVSTLTVGVVGLRMTSLWGRKGSVDNG
jgi:hypothetical protein